MGFSITYDCFIKHTHDPPVHPHHNLISQMPMNSKSKNSAKMDEEMEVLDELTPTAATPYMEWMPMHSSACLAEKLKKLMETPAQNTKAMDCKSDDPKKRSRAKDGKPHNLSSQGATATDSNPPDIKRSRNGATPPLIAIEHAQHNKKSTQNQRTTKHHHQSKETKADMMETIDEDDEPNNGEAKEADVTEAHKVTEEQVQSNIGDTTIDDKDKEDSEDEQSVDDEKKDETPEDAKPPEKAPPQEATGEEEIEANESSDKEPLPI